MTRKKLQIKKGKSELEADQDNCTKNLLRGINQLMRIEPSVLSNKKSNVKRYTFLRPYHMVHIIYASYDMEPSFITWLEPGVLFMTFILGISSNVARYL